MWLQKVGNCAASCIVSAVTGAILYSSELCELNTKPVAVNKQVNLLISEHMLKCVDKNGRF